MYNQYVKFSGFWDILYIFYAILIKQLLVLDLYKMTFFAYIIDKKIQNCILKYLVSSELKSNTKAYTGIECC